MAGHHSQQKTGGTVNNHEDVAPTTGAGSTHTREISRRAALQVFGTGAALSLLAACGGQAAPSSPAASASSAAASPASASAKPSVSTAASTAASSPASAAV